MTSNADLPHQNFNQQQQPLTKKKSNLSWIGFFIDLIIFHLLFGWGVATFGSYLTLEFVLDMTPFFLALAFADYIATMSYIKKQYPPWKVVFVPLLVINLIVLGNVLLGPLIAKVYFGSTLGLGLLGIYVYLFIVLLIDLVQVLVYVFTHHS